MGDVKDQIATATIATSPKKKHNSNHLSVNQWIRSATPASQQPTSPVGFLFWNFRHRFVPYYWYQTWINQPPGCLTGGVPFNYIQLSDYMTIGEVPS